MTFNNSNISVSGPQQAASTYKTKVLKGNQSFATQVSEANMIYVIKYDFDLGGESVTIPENCVLQFEGGSLSNGTIFGNYTLIANHIVLKDVLLDGTFANDEYKISWFTESSLYTSENIDFACKHFKKINIDRSFILTNPIDANGNSCELYSDNNAVITIGCPPSNSQSNGRYTWFYFYESEYVNIHDIVIDFNNKQYREYDSSSNQVAVNGLFIENCRYANICNVEVKNYGSLEISGDDFFDAFYALRLWTTNEDSIYSIKDCTFSDIYVIGDGIEASNIIGFGACIYSASTYGIVKIDGINIFRCWNRSVEQKVIIDDFDGIKVVNSVNVKTLLVSIENCYFENVSKRCIKAQGSNIAIRNIIYRNPEIDGIGYIPASSIIQPFGDRIVIEHVDAKLTTGGDIFVIGNGHNTNITVRDVTAYTDTLNPLTNATYGIMVGYGATIQNCNLLNLTFAISYHHIPNDSTYGGMNYGYGNDDIMSVDGCKFNNCMYAICPKVSDDINVVIRDSLIIDSYINCFNIELHRCSIKCTRNSPILTTYLSNGENPEGNFFINKKYKFLLSDCYVYALKLLNIENANLTEVMLNNCVIETANNSYITSVLGETVANVADLVLNIQNTDASVLRATVWEKLNSCHINLLNSTIQLVSDLSSNSSTHFVDNKNSQIIFPGSGRNDRYNLNCVNI